MTLLLLATAALAAAPKDEIRWTPFVAGAVGADWLVGQGASGFGSLEGGVNYGTKTWGGDVFLRPAGCVGGGLQGGQLDLVGRIGVRRPTWAAYAGLLGRFDSYRESYTSLGAGLPLTLTVGSEELYGFGEVAPTISSARGFEVEAKLGAGLRFATWAWEGRFAARTFGSALSLAPQFSVSYYGF
ncbi:hypothetical protein LBMAG42_45770 [Deltaproteobacteria bacterium]|nr:hypothetical protein LBMAG42_45770 [Deltaproteobacteria bacterium]